MRTMEFSAAFPKRTTIDPYLAIVEAAGKTGKGSDGNPLVITEEFDTAQLAIKAARVIRNYSQNHHLDLRVHYPKNGRSIFVYKGKPRASSPRKKKDESEDDTE
jgi:hypothetical protein